MTRKFLGRKGLPEWASLVHKFPGRPGLHGVWLAFFIVVGGCAAPPAATVPSAATATPAEPVKATPGEHSGQPAIRQEVIKLPHEYPARKNSSLVPQELPSAKQLMGLTRPRLLDILGSPGFKRRDISVEIWQYRDDICILDVFLYRQKGGENFHVKYIEVRDRSVAKVTLKDCYLGLIQKYSKKNG